MAGLWVCFGCMVFDWTVVVGILVLWVGLLFCFFICIMLDLVLIGSVGVYR